MNVERPEQFPVHSYCSQTERIYMPRKAGDMRIAMFPEGPIAFNGSAYCYSKGERLYIDRLAEFFKAVTIVSFVYQPGDDMYLGCSHSAFQSANIDIVELPFNPSARYGVPGKAVHFFRVFLHMLSTVKEYDLLYLFLPSYPSAMAWVIGRLRHIPHIVYVADDWEQASPCMFKWDGLRGTAFYRLYVRLNRWMEQSIGRSAMFSVTAGAQTREKFKTFGRPVEETTPRISLSLDDIIEREDTCGGEVITLISVGTLNMDKAQHILVRAFAKAAAGDSRLRLNLVGDGPRMEALKQLSTELDMSDRVEFAGYILDESDLYGHYQRADIFVLTSVSEGFPRVIYEAMAMGLPVVTTACGGIPLLVKDKVNGRVLGLNDVEGIAAAILEIINDRIQRMRLIRNGRSTVMQKLEQSDPRQIARLVERYA
jgi:glycosyltransferase involved in cell wall biosynthesis